MFDLYPDLKNISVRFAEIGVAIGLLIYIVFSFIVMKQVTLMTDTLKVDFDSKIKVIARLHLIAAFLLLLFSIYVMIS